MKNIAKMIISILFPYKFVFRRIKNNSNKIAITFDDGPHPDNTKILLKILKDENTKATFFVSGLEVEKYPGLICEIKKSGHEIGNHSYSHRTMLDMGFDAYKKDFSMAKALIENTNLFRPPYGEISAAILKFVLEKKLRYIGWTVDSEDSYIKDKERLIESIKQKSIKSGDIILFHEDYVSTIEAMREVLKNLKMRGFKLVSVSELLKG